MKHKNFILIFLLLLLLFSCPRGTIQVMTNPQKATVFIDGREHGRTPCFLEIGTGTHILELKLEGYGTLREEIIVQGKRHLSLNYELELIKAEITITSKPDKADVYINGRLAGKTPVNSYRMTPGTCYVRIAREGYASELKQLEVTAEEGAVINAVLKKAPRLIRQKS